MNLRAAASKVESVLGAEISGSPLTKEEEKRQTLARCSGGRAMKDGQIGKT